MRRRVFVTLLAVAATGWPLAARAQQSVRLRRIGAMTNFAMNDPETQVWVGAFRKRLQELGWGENENVRIEEDRKSVV